MTRDEQAKWAKNQPSPAQRAKNVDAHIAGTKMRIVANAQSNIRETNAKIEKMERMSASFPSEFKDAADKQISEWRRDVAMWERQIKEANQS